MKLKKIASLALAGLMAVGMLAGCNNGNSGSSSSEGTTVVTVSAADAMNAVQSIVKFEDGSTMDSLLASAAKNVTYDQLKAANVNGGLTTTTDKVAEELNAIMPGKYKFAGNTTNYLSQSGNRAAAGKSVTALYLYLVDDVTSKEAALNTAAKAVFGVTATSSNFPTLIANHAASYTGEVSIAQVSKTNEEGKTASAYYILMAVTQSVEENAVTSAT